MKVWDICKIIDKPISVVCDGCGRSRIPLVALGAPCFAEIYLCKHCLKKLLLALELKSKDNLTGQRLPNVIYLDFKSCH